MFIYIQERDQRKSRVVALTSCKPFSSHFSCFYTKNTKKMSQHLLLLSFTGAFPHTRRFCIWKSVTDKLSSVHLMSQTADWLQYLLPDSAETPPSLCIRHFDLLTSLGNFLVLLAASSNSANTEKIPFPFPLEAEIWHGGKVCLCLCKLAKRGRGNGSGLLQKGA